MDGRLLMLGWFKRSSRKTDVDAATLANRVKAGFDAHASGDLDGARDAYEDVLRIAPDHADANYLLGVLDMNAGRLQGALARFDRAIAAGPPAGSFHFSRGEALRALDRLPEAIGAFEAALQLPDPDAEWAVELGRTLEATGRRSEALDVFRRASTIDPRSPLVWWHLGRALVEDGREEEGEVAFRSAVALSADFLPAQMGLAELLRKRGAVDEARAIYEAMQRQADSALPGAINLAGLLVDCKQFDQAERVARAHLGRHGDSPDLWLNLGNALMGQERFAEAREVLERAATLDPRHWRALLQLATSIERSGDLAAAESRLYEALAVAPEAPEVHCALATLLRRQKAFGEAEAEFRRAIELRPDYAAAWINYAELLQRTSRLEAAAGALEHAVKSAPGMHEAHLNRGSVLMHLGRFDDAVASLQRALELKPDLHGAWITLAAVHLLASRLAESEQACRRALEISPDDTDVLVNLGSCLQQQGRLREAVEVTRRVVGRRPDFALAWSNLLLNQNYDDAVDVRALFREHQAFGRNFGPRRDRGYFVDRLPPGSRRLRIGYVSPDFRNHVVAMFFEAVLDAHDRSAFEVICYHSDNRADDVTDRLRASADLWRDIAAMDDDEAETLMLADRLDVVVDLAGHTSGNRLALIGRRVAPVQATWLGYPNTSGLPAMDWRITDARADPPGLADEIHTEKLHRLPEVFLAYRPRSDAPAVTDTPCIANGHVTFGSFNNFAKISDSVIRLWGEILAALPDARLRMKTMSLRDSEVQKALYDRLARLGCDVGRVTLSGPVPGLANHLASLGQVDIALDAYPYHGTTTTCECLWMGVPVVTLAGDRHASRVGVSLLSSVGAHDLISTSPEAYVEKAVALARDRTTLERWRRELRPRMQASPLTDHVRFARHLESAYRQMLEEWRREC
jgi:predicted O-linked N-acetylglucosamine transferase (SPINDLY family)